MTSTHEETARATKAFRLTRTLLDHEVPVSEARTFEAPQWEIVAKAARVNPPSPVTVALVLTWLAEQESEAR